MITMVLGGLWHGAAWTFVLWGAFHGVGLIARARVRRRVRSAGVAALVRHVPPRRVRVDPVPLAEPRAGGQLHLAACSSPGPATLWSRPGRRSAIVVVIGLQLLPRSGVERLADPDRAPPAGRARRRPRRPDPVRRRDRVRARASPRSSTSASDMPPHRTDDSLMSRFDQHGLPRFRARDAIWSRSLVCACCSCSSTGASARRAGEQMDPGIGRDIVLAVGKPAGWIADALPLARARRRRDGVALARTRSLDGDGSFADARAADRRGVPPVTPDAFDPAAARRRSRRRRRPLQTLLVTGDSMSTPLDAQLARAAGADGREGDPRAAPRHGHLQELPRRLGPAVRRPGPQATSRTRSSSSSAPTRASR